ncbi:MAG: YggT family protein [Mycobacteriales bacterium]|nr:MAG: YggT family protein [Pseudonocardiales bacterium]
MSQVWQALYFVLLVFLLLLIARFVVEWVMQLARRWRPSGVMAAGLEVVYSATDPPLKLLRKLIPPLRLGGVSIDLGFIVLFFAIYIVMGVVASQG